MSLSISARQRRQAELDGRGNPRVRRERRHGIGSQAAACPPRRRSSRGRSGQAPRDPRAPITKADATALEDDVETMFMRRYLDCCCCFRLTIGVRLLRAGDGRHRHGSEIHHPWHVAPAETAWARERMNCRLASLPLGCDVSTLRRRTIGLPVAAVPCGRSSSRRSGMAGAILLSASSFSLAQRIAMLRNIRRCRSGHGRAGHRRDP